MGELDLMNDQFSRWHTSVQRYYPLRLWQRAPRPHLSLGLALTLLLALTGCGADLEDSDSDPGSPPSVTIGDALIGQEQYQQMCLGCHGEFDAQGVSAGGLNGSNPLNTVNWYRNSQPEIVAGYITSAMPPGNQATDCGQECGNNIASYFFSLGKDAAGSGDGEQPTGLDVSGMSGAEVYAAAGCLGCHGNDAQQRGAEIQFQNYTLKTLTRHINDYMPKSDLDPNAAQQCVGACAQKAAEYVWSLRPQVSCDDGAQALPQRLRLLTKFEYVNTINDLFARNDGETLASGVSSDTVVRGFDNNAEGNAITSARMDSYWNAAQNVAEVVDVTPWLNTHNCGQQDPAYCFVESFGRRAFRRDLNDDEKDEYRDLFAAGANEEQGARYVVQAMLVSPNFLYRTELGENGRLTQYEVASLLAYTFWGSTPDEQLLDRARGNNLGNAEQLRQVAQSMVSDPRARRQFVHFGRQWLDVGSVVGLDRDRNLFPAFTGQVAAAMDREVELFLEELLLGDDYTMADFFVSDFVFVNQALANFYGINGVSGENLRKVDATAQRGGVLTLGALLARNSKFDESHPIHRGLLVRNKLLCQEFAAPPADIGEVEPFDPSKPTRERFAAHSSEPACAACHQFIDEIGFAFEHYDAVGQYRAAEADNMPVDASGMISGLSRMTDPDMYAFGDLQDLSHILATEGLEPTAKCLAEQFHRMMDGLAQPDQCTVASNAARWQPQVNSIKDLWIEIVASQIFTQRQ